MVAKQTTIWFLSIAALTLCAVMPSYAEAPAGDPARGKQLAIECAACHGVDGNSPSPVNPKLSGQHELYLFMALQAYVDGSRPDSLMRGAVLNKSEQDLRDIAAFFSRQGEPGGDPAQAGNGGEQGGRVMGFDHGDRTAAFTSLVARAETFAKAAKPVGADACPPVDTEIPADQDGDGDGVADRYDAAPEVAWEFAADNNDDGVYEICNAHQLQALSSSQSPRYRSQRLTRSYQLVRDLDLSEHGEFEPIGDCGPSGNCMRAGGEFGFAGVFDGQGYTISHLTVALPQSGGVGLFGVLAEPGVVMNLNLDKVAVKGRAGTGALVGSNFGVVFNSTATGNVEGGLAIGGLVGGSGGLVYSSQFSGTVAGEQAIGGLVGDMTGAVYYSKAAGSVKGQRGVGGLVGLSTFGSVLGSAAAGEVFGTNDVGGLVGVNTDAKVRNSFASGPVTAQGSNVGGLIGFNSLSSVRNSYARGRVGGRDGVGGLVGRNNGLIAGSYATGPVQGDGVIGGIVGIVVEGTQVDVFTARDNPAPYGAEQVELAALTGESSGWIPAGLPSADLLNYFCDNNRNGFIDPLERAANNYVWRFGTDSGYPVLGCAAELK